jgi:hypothetical protein
MRSIFGLIWIILVLSVAACSGPSDKDRNFQIATESQAVDYARSMLFTTRIENIDDLEFISAEKMSRADAEELVSQPSGHFQSGPTGDAQVWLVVFEGDYRIAPPDPDHTYTPEPLTHGCVFSIFDAVDGDFMQMGTQPCDVFRIEP